MINWSLPWAHHQAHTEFLASRTASSSNPSGTHRRSAAASWTTLRQRAYRRRHRKSGSGFSASSSAVEARRVLKRRQYVLLSLNRIICLSLGKEIYDFCQEDITKYVRIFAFGWKVVLTLPSSQRYAVKKSRFTLSNLENIF